MKKTISLFLVGLMSVSLTLAELTDEKSKKTESERTQLSDDELQKLKEKPRENLTDEEIQKARIEGFGDLSKPQNFELVVPKF